MTLTEDYQLHVEQSGEGPTLLCIHGFASSSFTWRHIASAFADRFRVWTVDLLGHGLSPKPRGADYSVHEQARLILNVIHEHDMRDLTIIGHSFGGGVSLRIAMDLLGEPGRLRRLVLIGSVAFKQKLPPFVQVLRRPILGRVLPRLVSARMSGQRALNFAYHDRSRIQPDQVEGWAAPLRLKGTHESLRRTALQILPENLDELTTRYSEVDVPALLVWGRHDRIVPMEIGERLDAALPDSRLHVLENCGHVPHEEIPGQTIEIIDGFLSVT